MHEGLQVWTEHEIQCGKAPVKEVAGKVPDGLYDVEEGLVWVEVENSWKNRAERQKIADFIASKAAKDVHMSLLAPESYLYRVDVVCNTRDSFSAISRTLQEAHAVQRLSDSAANDTSLVLLEVDGKLNADKYRSYNFYYDLLNS
ncbi:hypothetical protein RB24_26225 [Herbaspirillum rubrisubalbicans]|uniref:Uncharacterized protein n=2 Tax=Herbaspirillum rubrisubalbicans TaxID=80842 RepID=A0ABX9BU39_9BURK|nr:hypothetical protein RB24_26225 [Herbaspirillum rubrisubalbicans]